MCCVCAASCGPVALPPDSSLAFTPTVHHWVATLGLYRPAPCAVFSFIATSHERKNASQGHRKGEEDDVPPQPPSGLVSLHPCPHCGREFTPPSSLGKHLLSCGPHALAIDASKCPRCDRSFRQAAGLAAHLKCCNAGTQPSDPSTACSPTNPDFASVAPVCPRCFKSFKSSGGFGKHLLTCSVTTNEHVCPVCPRSFR